MAAAALNEAAMIHATAENLALLMMEILLPGLNEFDT
jgi:hypothetical protein